MMKKSVSVTLISVLVFSVFYCGLNFLFKSEMLEHFIWQTNTFHGMFANLPDHLPQDDILGAYYYAFKDFYDHAPRSVNQNAPYYAAFLAFLISFFISQHLSLKFSLKHFRSLSLYLLIFGVGLFLRLFFAYHTTCNHDMASWYINKTVLDSGQNIFAVTDRYNYSPFWFLILKQLSALTRLLGRFSFMFVVRSFLTAIDLFTAILLIFISQKLHFSTSKAIALFFLNPVSIILTGYHGQFDNIPILFVLLAVFSTFLVGNVFLGWILVTIGMIAKHEILQQVLVFLNDAKIRKRTVFILFGMSIALFFISFGSYWIDGAGRILRNVLEYGGMRRPYGLINFQGYPIVGSLHKFLFISLLLIWPFIYRTANKVKSALMSMLFFLVFTSGISTQQFVLPIALGALVPSAGFFLFSTAASLFLFGNIDELKIIFFQGMSWNYVWFCVFIWFLLELKIDQSNLNRQFSIPKSKL